MKRMLLTGLCLVALGGRANAQGIEVHDTTSMIQQIRAYLVQAKSLATQAQQYAVAARQLQAEVQTLEAFVHSPNIGAAMGLVNQAGYGNDLPVNPLAVQSLMNGYGGLLGRVGTLGSLVNSSYTANHLYSPTDQGFASQELVSNGNALAGTQGAAEAAYQDLRNHLPVITALSTSLTTATDPKDVMDLQARLQAEAVWTASLNSQLSSIQIAAQAEDASREQRAREWMDKGLDDHMAALTVAGRGL